MPTHFRKVEKNSTLAEVFYLIVLGIDRVKDIQKYLEIKKHSTISTRLNHLKQSGLVRKNGWNYEIKWKKVGKFMNNIVFDIIASVNERENLKKIRNSNIIGEVDDRKENIFTDLEKENIKNKLDTSTWKKIIELESINLAPILFKNIYLEKEGEIKTLYDIAKDFLKGLLKIEDKKLKGKSLYKLKEVVKKMDLFEKSLAEYALFNDVSNTEARKAISSIDEIIQDIEKQQNLTRNLKKIERKFKF